MNNLPFITVITPTYNSAEFLDACILSVAQQTYTNKKHLIIDNLSTDDTLTIISKYSTEYPHIQVISEKDNGIYDAMNKAIEKSSGEWLYFLGSDDTFYDNDVLSDLFSSDVSADNDIIYGNVQWGQNGNIYDGEFSFFKLLEKNICHQSIFFRRSVFNKMGNFDLKYHALSDWAFNIQWFGRDDIQRSYTDRVIAVYNPFGFSSIHYDAIFYKDQAYIIEQYFPKAYHLLFQQSYQIKTMTSAMTEREEEIRTLTLSISKYKDNINTLNTSLQHLQEIALTNNIKITALENTINKLMDPNEKVLTKLIRKLSLSIKKRSKKFYKLFCDLLNRMDSKNEQQIFSKKHFDVQWYILQNPDIATSSLDPYIHYFIYGKKENRKARYFDSSFYLLHNQDLLNHDIDLYSHYLTFGIKEERKVKYFDATLYLKLYKDVALSEFDPYYHYVNYGKHEGRRLDLNYFITDIVLHTNDIKSNSIIDIHREEFNCDMYLAFNRDISQETSIDPYDHYIHHGKFEGRTAIKTGKMLNIETQPIAEQVQGSIAIHLHLYYIDLMDEFRNYLKNMPFTYDLYVSVVDKNDIIVCKKAFSGLPFMSLLVIEPVPNRGRDIAPMFCAFGHRLKDYDYIAHIHSKKSLYNNGATEGWREYLCVNLLGSDNRIRKIFKLMQGNSPRGIVYPQNFARLPYQANCWLSNKTMGQEWCARLGISSVPQGYFDFPAGSMFWAKGDALKPLFDIGINIDDFAEESGQTDGTFAHCLERLLVISSLKQGYNPAIIQDLEHPSWSAWGFKQYTDRSFQHMVDQLSNPAIKVIAFDIFDTLLCRPLLDPEATKSIVAERLGGEVGWLYLQNRPIAEDQARIAAGRDIGMKDIYKSLGRLTNFSNETLSDIRSLEEEVEKASLVLRSGADELFRQALATGKPVVLISDMFLPKEVIEKCLQNNGINGWSNLFLSNEIGLRKDTGNLYDFVFSHYRIIPSEMIMIGDNERSDVQIPGDKGACVMHLFKPIEFARGLPRFRDLIERNERSKDLNIELTLGLVLLENFSAIHYPNLDIASILKPTAFNIGYSIIGPLLLGFSQWLLESARIDGIERLYFLSREGQLIKRIYDIWSEGLDDLPQVDYLVLSRRAISVPMIEEFEAILEIARTTYFNNTITNFLWERYGLELNEERWAQVTSQLQWSSQSIVEVHNKNIDNLIPLLRLLEPDIIEVKNYEYPAMKHYVQQIGLEHGKRQAVVDIGYSATIQDYLNQCIKTPVHGYYIMTHQASLHVKKKNNVLIRGCFHENVDTNSLPPLMYRNSFTLEKFLSSNDAQVIKYELKHDQNPVPLYRELTHEENECSGFRNELQDGVIRYAREATRIRRSFYPNFKPSCSIAKQLFNAFIALQSPMETDLLQSIVLDDHYCGRGIV